jgi:hypothetical protein
MITVLTIFFGLIFAGLAIGLLATITAPLGYEDETGFHLGCEEGAAFEEVGSRNPELESFASSHA